MIVTTKVEMDLQRSDQTLRMQAVQNDCNTRCLEVALNSGGVPWNIPEDAVAAMRYRKLDGTQGYYDTLPDGLIAWNVNGNVLSMILAPQMLTTPGTVVAQLELTQGSSVLATGLILISVTENPGYGAVTSEDYINWAQWMQKELDAHMNRALESGAFTGPAGEPGEAAVMLSAVVMYQVGESGKEVPSGQWQADIPATDQGGYLWTRTVYVFNTGDPVTQYSVSRLDGSAASVKKVSAVLLESGWSNALPYTQTITIDGLSDEKNARAYPEAPAGTLEEKLSMAEEMAKIRWCTRSGSGVTFECPEKKPNLDIPVIVEVYV